MKTSLKKTALLLFIAFSFISHTVSKQAPWVGDQLRQRNPNTFAIYVALEPLDTPHRNSLQNIAWTIYAYPLVDVICQELICAQRTKKTENYHARLKDIPLTVLWGVIKEVLIRVIWDSDYKKSAVVAHLILQNLCSIRRTPTAESFRKMLAESACKTFMPPLLVLAQNLRNTTLHQH